MRTSIALVLLAGTLAFAQDMSASHTLTVTNTSNQVVKPLILIAHDGSYAPYTLGAAASPELALMAEDGDASDLATIARISPGVHSVVLSDAPLPPGESATLTIESGDAPYLTLLGMLVTTNDAFVAWTASVSEMDAMGGAMGAMDAMAMAPAFADGVVRVLDSGSEANTENCEHIPGPPCGQAGVRVTEGAEGEVHLHGGILGVGDLDPAEWDWLNPVVTVSPGM